LKRRLIVLFCTKTELLTSESKGADSLPVDE
jgi:hypothetical protein